MVERKDRLRMKRKSAAGSRCDADPVDVCLHTGGQELRRGRRNESLA